MNTRQMARMAVDCAMTVVLLLLMGYSRVGEAAHEWLGVAMFALFAVHHVLNRRWTASLLKGRYDLARTIQTVLVILLVVTMLGSAASGVVLSRHVFGFLDLGGAARAREIHMLCGHWNFVLMSLHLGLHWAMISRMVSKTLPKDNVALVWVARIVAVLITGYGAYALVARQMPAYLFGKVKFAFIDPSEPLVLFLADHVAIMGLFVFIAHYGLICVRKVTRRRRSED